VSLVSIAFVAAVGRKLRPLAPFARDAVRHVTRAHVLTGMDMSELVPTSVSVVSVAVENFHVGLIVTAYVRSRVVAAGRYVVIADHMSPHAVWIAVAAVPSLMLPLTRMRLDHSRPFASAPVPYSAKFVI